MRLREITFETLAEEEVLQRVEGKLKRAEKTAPKRNRPLRNPPNKQEILSRILKMTSIGAGCWNWIGSKDRCGYGKMRFGRESLAHRLSWLAHGNSIPAGYYICHKCDNPSCVNPDHMFSGPQVENVRDMFSKGRDNGPKGIRVNTAVLSPEDVLEIRKIYREKMGKLRVRRGTMESLSRKYGVHKSTIHHVVRGKTWKSDCPL
jgi:hypothetical protein